MDRVRSVSLLAWTLGLLLTGCDDNLVAPPSEDPGFTVQIDGALTETATGAAYFGVETDPELGEVWALLLAEEEGRHVVVVARAGSTRPGPGSYTLDEAPESEAAWTVTHVVGNGEELVGMFLAESGTLIVTASSASEIRGTLSFQGTGMLGAIPDTVNVTGSFVAVPASSSPAPAGISGGRP